jgi:hypothetical protein
MSAEEEVAMVRAVAWVRLDPFYEAKELTAREEALMRLAIRTYSAPNLVVSSIRDMREGRVV